MPPHFQTFPPNNSVPTGNNGIEAHPPEQPDDAHKQQRGRPRPLIQQQPQPQQSQAPPMYPNNNGYNRPRQNRSGGRPNNRQHQ